MEAHYDNRICWFREKNSRAYQESKKRKKKAKKTKVKRYFKGQRDAFEQILIKLKNLKYELETNVEDDEEDKEEIEQKLEEKEGENLLKKALESGVIIRKTSFYLHDDLPNGKAHGKKRILQALSERNFFENIQNQIARTEDTIKEEKKE